MRSIALIDRETIIQSVRKTHRLIVADEDYLSYGVTQKEKDNYYDQLKKGKMHLFISPKKVHMDDLNDSSQDIDSIYEDAIYRINTRGL